MVAVAAQPFQLVVRMRGGIRRHVPDVLLVGREGGVAVVDAKALSRLADPGVRAQFSWTRRLAGLRGWGFEVWSGADRVLLDNVRFWLVTAVTGW
jgi:hypothetical protein